MELMELFTKGMALSDEIVEKLNALDNEVIALAVIGTTIDNYFIKNEKSVREGWKELIETSSFAHDFMGDD